MIIAGSARLVERAKAGDSAAFQSLIDPLVDPAFRLAMVMLGNRAAAEDAVQEAMFRAWRKLHTFRDGADLRPWILTIVANECRSVRRSRWWSVLGLGGRDTAPRRGLLEARLADRDDLVAALDRLPRQHLLPLGLYYLLDLPIDDVARVLGCSRGAAKQRVHRALLAVRNRVKEVDP